MKKKVLYTLVLGVLFANLALTSIEATAAEAPSSKTAVSRGVRPTEKSGFAPSQGGPMNAPPPGGGIGTVGEEGEPEVPGPIGDAPFVVLLTAITIYLSAVFIRKQRFEELRIKELRTKS